jgi:hypothetical protein
MAIAEFHSGLGEIGLGKSGLPSYMKENLSDAITAYGIDQ